MLGRMVAGASPSYLCPLVVCLVAGGAAGAAGRAADLAGVSINLTAIRRSLAADDVEVAVPAAALLDVERIEAFEDHEHFAYVCGTGPGLVRRVICLRTGLLVCEEQRAASGQPPVESAALGAAPADVVRRDADGVFLRGRRLELPAVAGEPGRSIWVVAWAAGREPVLPASAIHPDGDGAVLEVSEAAGGEGRRLRLKLPAGPHGGQIEILAADQTVVPKRLLPAGILPVGLAAARRRLQWDLPYELGTAGIWETGQPSTELRRQVESGRLPVGRVVEIGCGTGSDAIYLASRGFSVTAIDIAPTALAQARERAARAGVKVTWLLADILHPPWLEPFDLVYDRGCYHELRQHFPARYAAAVSQLARPGGRVLILSGRAGLDPAWRFEGPPRVTEREIRADFAAGFRLLELREMRFDPAAGQDRGALAWSILLERSP
jgi:SAM-dependent methyltransferase